MSLTYVYEHLAAENNKVIYMPVTTIKWRSKFPVATSNQTV